MAQMKDPATSAVSAGRLQQELKNMKVQWNLSNEQYNLVHEQVNAAKGAAQIGLVTEELYRSPVGKAALKAQLLANSAQAITNVIKPFNLKPRK
jgi:hypothetical protein